MLLFTRYATRLQAEKALAAGHGSRLTGTVMLGVQRVSDDEASAVPARSGCLLGWLVERVCVCLCLCVFVNTCVSFCSVSVDGT